MTSRFPGELLNSSISKRSVKGLSIRATNYIGSFNSSESTLEEEEEPVLIATVGCKVNCRGTVEGACGSLVKDRTEWRLGELLGILLKQEHDRLYGENTA